MFTVEERAWRYCRRTMLWQESEREIAEQSMGYAAARLTVAMADLRRASFAGLPRAIRRFVRWVAP